MSVVVFLKGRDANGSSGFVDACLVRGVADFRRLFMFIGGAIKGHSHNKRAQVVCRSEDRNCSNVDRTNLLFVNSSLI